MQSLLGKKITRSLLLGGTATAALVSANPALAVTATQPVITSVVGNTTSCTISFTTSVTGTVQDFGGDRYLLGAGDSNSPIVATLSTIGVGQTVAVSSSQAVSFNFVTGPLRVGVWETTSTQSTGVVAVTVVPRALLQAAGGRCVNAIFNNPPVANAGADITATPSTLTTLTGAASSDADGDPLTYQWQQISGPAVTLNGATTVAPTFTAPVATNQIRTLIFRLIVNDGSASSSADTVAVTIPAGPNTLPVANAGPDANIQSGAPRTLAGTATDLDNDPLTYAWTQTAGPVVAITNANTANASFVAPVRTGAPQLLTFSLVANDGFGNSAADTVTLTVPANRLPTANAGADATINAGSTRALTGSATDLDGDALTYQWVQTAGPSVTIVNPTSANASFVAPASTGAIQTLTFSLVANDGLGNSSPDTVTFTIPANSPPTVNAGPDQTRPAGSAVVLAGTATDPESNPLTYLWTQTAGPSVALSGATTLTPGFTAPPKTGAPQVLTFSLTANDGTSTSVADTVDIAIPANVGPTANAGPDATAAGGSRVTLAGTVTDGDGDPVGFVWTQVAGPTVALAGSTTANPSFDAPARTNAAQVLTFQLVGTDGFVNSAADTVNITIPSNIAPVANAGPDASAAGGSNVSLNGTGSSDAENDPISFAWSQVGGPAVTLTGASTATPAFVAPAKTASAQLLSFALDVSDGVATDTDIVDIAIPANVGPTANAGQQQTVNGGSTVTLNGGTSTDGDGDALTYSWVQTAGPAVTLTGANTATPSFTAPAANGLLQNLAFALTVSDGIATSSASVDVNVNANATPIANAGADATAAGGSNVTLNGSGSDPDNDPITFAWTQTSGPAVTLTGATSATPSFVAPPKAVAAQILTFSLGVSDGVATGTDSVNITIPANVGPTANAGPDATAAGGSRVTLAGTVTDGDGDPVAFVWTQVAGPTVALAGSTTASPSFNAPTRTNAAQVLTFQLVGFDGFANSAPDTVDITIPANAAPVANAGADATVAGRSNVSLNGTASSDPENDPLSFAWTQIAGPTVTLAGAATATPTFVAPAKTGAVQVLSFSLAVNDGVDTGTDVVDISVTANVGPTANAGVTRAVNGGTTVTLNGAASTDGDGDTLTYSWAQTGGTAVTLTGANTATPSFVAPAGIASIQNLTFALTVSDGVASSTATVGININPNSPPVANAGVDQGPINTGSVVTLNGSASNDPDGNPLTYRWTQVSGPTATLSSATSANPTFVAPNVNGSQNLVFQLVVNDGTVDSPPDTVIIAVRAVGSVTVIQRVVGADGSFSFTSSIAALSGAIITSNGIGQRSATLVPAGSHSLVAADARVAGYAVTAISCNDTDSIINLANRSIGIALSPNENLVCTFTSTNTRDAASVAIRNFLTARNAAILANRPDLQRRLDRLDNTPASGGNVTAFSLPVPGSGRLPFSANVGNGESKFASSLAMARTVTDGPDRGNAPVDIWAEAYFASLNYPGHKGRFSIIHAGTDYRVSDGALLGVSAQFDRYSPKGGMTAGAVKGNGWMVGPYATFKLAPELYADVRAAWGKSDNTVSPLGTFIDGFDTSRALFSGSMIGQFDLGDATQFRPEVSLRYLGEKQRAYTDSLGVVIPEQKVGQGDLSFRPRFHHTMDVGNGWSVRPFAEAEGIYTFGADSTTVLTGKFRMRIEGGADIFSISNIRASLSAFHDGIGGNGYKSTGAHVTFSFGF